MVSYPAGWPTLQDFRAVRVNYDRLLPGQVRVLNDFISVDPYMRFRMDPAHPRAFRLREAMQGGAVGRVVESAAEHLPVGSIVLHEYGWRDVTQESAGGFTVIREYPGVPHSLHLGMFGLVGLTAYAGLVGVARLRQGETVYVSGAAGAVGSTAGQLARLLGAGRVIGSAGSKEKIDLLTGRYGYDAAFNYKDGSIAEQLAAAAPDGIDVFFDNVGGEHRIAAFAALNSGGREVLCGAISAYNDAGPAFPAPDFRGVAARTTEFMSYSVANYFHLAPEFQALMAKWLNDGSIKFDETIVKGIEHAPQAFLDMMRGKNIGKMIVRTSS
ncbi:MAG: NADP-dependent oxidoreductase [Xanthobacteraceae bacterium]